MGWFRNKIEFKIEEGIAYLQKRLNTCNKRLKNLEVKKIYYKNCYNRNILDLEKFNLESTKLEKKFNKQKDLKNKLTLLIEDFINRKNQGVKKVFREEVKI